VIRSVVRLYWRFWPRPWKRSCIFRESCSQHVYRVAARSGEFAAIRALLARIRTCRPGYRLSVTDGRVGLVLANGVTLEEFEIAPELVSLALNSGGNRTFSRRGPELEDARIMSPTDPVSAR
jgi:hypothetical protein